MDELHWPADDEGDDPFDSDAFERALIEHARADYAELEDLNAA